MNKLVSGVGLNNADYVVNPTVNGKFVACPFYIKWQNMLKRCYSKKLQSRYPAYIGCFVCDEWLLFSNFKSWMEKQDWHGKELDKDLLIVGNKVYSPETCVFVDAKTNLFTNDSRAARGDYPLGVSFNKLVGKFQVRCGNPITRKQESLGYFNCQNLAHEAWRKRKHELACQLADLQDDARVAEALRTRYAT